MSWLAYVRQLRIDHAKTLLRNSHHNVITIAFECGFNDLSTFYRCFKKSAGVSPEKWRQQSVPKHNQRPVECAFDPTESEPTR